MQAPQLKSVLMQEPLHIPLKRGNGAGGDVNEKMGILALRFFREVSVLASS